MKKRLAIIITVCLVIVGIVLGVVFTRGAGRETTPETVTVTRGDVAKTVLVDGNLEMPDKAYLSFGITGTVKEVLVEEGNNVTKGQVLARLDAPSLELSVEMAELQVEMAEEQVKAAKEQYEKAKEGAGDSWEAPEGLEFLEGIVQSLYGLLGQDVDTAKANLDMAELNLESARLSLESAELNLKNAEIVAPFDGAVADITITGGEELSAATLTTPAITLVGTSGIQMQGYIDELDVASVKLGQAANITLDALPDEQVTGSVAFISPMGTVLAGIVSYATIITLENPSAELKDGMSATAEVIIERRDNVLLIPNTVIRGTLQSPMVKVLVDDQQEQRDITLGISDGRNTEVLSGLEEGEKVVKPESTSTQQSDSLFGV